MQTRGTDSTKRYRLLLTLIQSTDNFKQKSHATAKNDL